MTSLIRRIHALTEDPDWIHEVPGLLDSALMFDDPDAMVFGFLNGQFVWSRNGPSVADPLMRLTDRVHPGVKTHLKLFLENTYSEETLEEMADKVAGWVQSFGPDVLKNAFVPEDQVGMAGWDDIRGEAWSTAVEQYGEPEPDEDSREHDGWMEGVDAIADEITMEKLYEIGNEIERMRDLLWFSDGDDDFSGNDGRTRVFRDPGRAWTKTTETGRPVVAISFWSFETDGPHVDAAVAGVLKAAGLPASTEVWIDGWAAEDADDDQWRKWGDDGEEDDVGEDGEEVEPGEPPHAGQPDEPEQGHPLDREIRRLQAGLHLADPATKQKIRDRVQALLRQRNGGTTGPASAKAGAGSIRAGKAASKTGHDTVAGFQAARRSESASRIIRLLAEADRDCVDIAWGIMANAHGGDWSKASPEWVEAVRAWEREFKPYSGS